MTIVLAGSFVWVARSSARVAIVMVCQPDFASAVSCASNVSGGTTRLGIESPASATGTTRWYIRTGTLRVKVLAGAMAGAVTEIAVGTEAGSQLFTIG